MSQALRNKIQSPQQNIRLARTSSTQLREDGILQVDAYPDAEIKLADAIELINHQAALAAGDNRPLLVNFGKIKSIDRNARAYFGGRQAEKNVTASALVITSHIGRVIGNFMLGLNKPPYPVRLFTNEDEALTWLKEFLK